MPEKGTTDEQTTSTPREAEISGEEIGLLAATVAVGSGPEPRRRGLPRSVPTALWPDVQGVFFPEPYVVDFEWQQGPPEAAVKARQKEVEAPGDEADAPPLPAEVVEELEREKTFIDLEAEDLEPVDEVDLAQGAKTLEDLAPPEVAGPESRPRSGPDSVQPLDERDLEEIVDEERPIVLTEADEERPIVLTEADEEPPIVLTEADRDVDELGVAGSEADEAGAEAARPPPSARPPVPADAAVLDTRQMRAMRPPPPEGPVDDARVLPLERVRPLRRVQGPRPTRPQPNLIESAMGADSSTDTVTPGRPWYEVIFDSSYFQTLPKTLHRQTRKECRFVRKRLKLDDGAAILDLACGFGRHSIELAKQGYQVTGIDLSRHMIEQAQAEAERRKMSIRFRQLDMRELSYDLDFDAVLLLGYSFGFFDDRSNYEVLIGIRAALRPKGRLLLQLLNRDRLVRELPEVIWWRGQDCLVLEEVELDAETSRMASKRAIVFDDGRSPWEQFIEIRLYSLHEIYTMLERAGFRVLSLSGSIHHPGHVFINESRELWILAERERDFG